MAEAQPGFLFPTAAQQAGPSCGPSRTGRARRTSSSFCWLTAGPAPFFPLTARPHSAAPSFFLVRNRDGFLPSTPYPIPGKSRYPCQIAYPRPYKASKTPPWPSFAVSLRPESPSLPSHAWLNLADARFLSHREPSVSLPLWPNQARRWARGKLLVCLAFFFCSLATGNVRSVPPVSFKGSGHGVTEPGLGSGGRPLPVSSPKAPEPLDWRSRAEIRRYPFEGYFAKEPLRSFNM